MFYVPQSFAYIKINLGFVIGKPCPIDGLLVITSFAL